GDGGEGGGLGGEGGEGGSRAVATAEQHEVDVAGEQRLDGGERVACGGLGGGAMHDLRGGEAGGAQRVVTHLAAGGQPFDRGRGRRAGTQPNELAQHLDRAGIGDWLGAALPRLRDDAVGPFEADPPAHPRNRVDDETEARPAPVILSAGGKTLGASLSLSP